MRGRGHRAGRAARKRKRKREGAVRPAFLGHQSQYIRSMRFLHQRGFTSTLSQPASFSDTGRGSQTLHSIKPGESVISSPESCLLTTSTVSNSYSGRYIERQNYKTWKEFLLYCYFFMRFYLSSESFFSDCSWNPRLSPLLALCVFSVCERQRGEASDWFPYINVLPSSYTCPAYFSDTVVDVLPAAVRRRALEQREVVREIYSSNQEFFKTSRPVSNQPTEDVLTYEALRWAWCSVNTRSVYISRPSNSFSSGPDNYALAPFSDLLNHRPDVQVKAGFNDQTKCYEIRSVSGTSRHQQVFINYGSHDNQRSLLEYGFVTMNNPHSVVYVEPDHLRDVLRGDKSLDQKMKFLKENNFLQNLTVSSDGPSWRSTVALRLLSMPLTSYPSWKAVSLGQVVCEKTEARSNDTAWKLCQQSSRDAQTALDKICQLLPQCAQPLREQSEVAKALRQEERWISESCLTASKDSIHLVEEMASCNENVGAVS